MIIFFLIYWIFVIFLFFAGIINISASKTPESKKTGVQLTIISVVLFIIGASFCGSILSGIGGMH